MKRAFIDKTFRADTMAIIEQANQIIAEYQAADLKLTLRQLYYQFVSKNLIRNKDTEYKRLAGIISDARLAGYVDWDAIEDRGRIVELPAHWDSISDIIQASLNSYKLDRWKDQDNYVELWVEKQALAGVLQPLADEFHVPLMVNKGYSSSSAMYDAGLRFKRQLRRREGEGIIFYLGDHDPSGEDMVRDVHERVSMFADHHVKVHKLAITMDQIEEYNPPPNPAKLTDSRAAAYIAKHGDSSWEVDALPPKVLAQIIRGNFHKVIDREKMNAIKDQEVEDKKKIEDMLARLEE